MTLAVRICLMLAVPQASAFAFSGGRMVQPRVQAAAAHAPLQPALRAAPVQMADAPPPPQERKSSVPFFLDIGTKGGIVFYSIVGCVLPFVAYNFMLVRGAGSGSGRAVSGRARAKGRRAASVGGKAAKGR